MAETSVDRGREVRQRLTGAAADLIVERGWNGVSTRLVAERAGVTAGLVHYHFDSLRSLLARAALGEVRALVEGSGPLLERADTPRDALDLLLGSLSGYTGRDATCVLFVETYLAATRDPDVRAEVRAVLADFREAMARLLARHGVADPEATAAVLAAAVDGVMLHRALDPDLTAERVAPLLGRMLSADRSTTTKEDDE